MKYTHKENLENELLTLKLRFLHLCLTPEGLKKINWEKKEDPIAIVKKSSTDGNNELSAIKIEGVWETFVNLQNLSKNEKDNRISEDYTNALKDLRRVLLPDE